MIATTINIPKIASTIAISGCRSLSQSPGVIFFALGVVENLRFAVGIVILSLIVPEICISGLGATLPFPVVCQCRNDLATLFGLAMAENPGLRFWWPYCYFRLSANVAFICEHLL